MSAMTPKQAGQLKSLVGLKRQKAEQDLVIVQQDIGRIEAELAGLAAEIAALDLPSEVADGASLSGRQAHAERLIAQTGRKKAALAARLADLDAAREALKRVIHSEDRLDDL